MLILLPKAGRNDWWLKRWHFTINGVVIGTIYKQIYPGTLKQLPELIFKFVPNYNIIPGYWKGIPKGEAGYIEDHYKNLKEARKALKKAFIAQLNHLHKTLE